MAKPLFTTDQIIASGENLEAQTPGKPVEAWEVFSELGARGKFDRVREIWEGHVASRSALPRSEAVELPAEVDAAIGSAIDRLGEQIRGVFVAFARDQLSHHLRQMQVAQKTHEDESARGRAELAFWRERALAIEDASDDAGNDDKTPKPRANASSARSRSSKRRQASKKDTPSQKPKPPEESRPDDPDQPLLI